MNKKIIFSALIVSCSLLNVMASENPFSKKQKPLFNAKSTLKPMGDKYIWIGANISTLSNVFTGTLFGAGLNGLYSTDGERNAYFFDIASYFPKEVADKSYVNSGSSSTIPSSMEINTATTYSAFGARLGYRRYFINDMVDDGFKLYAQGYVGVQFYKANTVAKETYDMDLYHPSWDSEGEEASGLTIGGGLGAEYSSGTNLSFFTDINLNLPATSAGDTEIEVEIPVSFQISLGAKYLLFQ